jgi:hypothetical protein
MLDRRDGRPRGSGTRLVVVAIATIASLFATAPAIATVVARDLDRQLRLIDAGHGGVVVHGRIRAIRRSAVPALYPSPFRVLDVEILDAIAPATVAPRIEVFVPGFGEQRLSFSSQESETAVGSTVVLFLKPDARVREIVPGAFLANSFAEVFRTTRNRKGEYVVLGEGKGCAIEVNERLTAFRQRARRALERVTGGG